jgi:hypothetical protein
MENSSEKSEKIKKIKKMKVAQKLDFFNFSYYIIMYNENKK